MNKLSILIEEQFPDYYKENAPDLIDFIEAYYEWMETQGEAVHGIDNLLNYKNIDRTIGTYIEYFQEEFLGVLPKNVVADKRLLVKHATDFYRSKGTEKSFKLLFRLLYNEDIDLYYPRDNILRASDGVWVEEKILRVEYALDPDKVFNMNCLEITGATSGATAIVERVNKKVASGRIVFDLLLSNIDGTFQDLETITDTNGQTATILGVLDSLNVIDGGAFHQINDTVSVSSGTSDPSEAEITEIDDMSAVKFVISAGGSGYRNAGNTIINVSGGSGQNALFKITNTSIIETIVIYTDQIGALAAVPIDALTKYGSHPNQNSANYTLSANLSNANVSTQFVTAWGTFTANTGAITGIEPVTYGYDYNDALPAASAVDPDIAGLNLSDGSGGIKGRNASFNVQYVNGAIETVKLDVKQTDVDYTVGQVLTLSNSTRNSTVNATANVSTKTGIFSLPGRYDGTRGWLSSDMRLQDNDYWQIYSYVIQVKKSLADYEDIVKRAIHPAGMRMFGEYRSNEKLSASLQYSVVGSAASPQIYIQANGYVVTTAGSDTVTGVGTVFLTDYTAGANLVINTVNSQLYVVQTIANNTSMTIKPTAAETLSGAQIYKVS